MILVQFYENNKKNKRTTGDQQKGVNPLVSLTELVLLVLVCLLQKYVVSVSVMMKFTTVSAKNVTALCY